MNARTFTVVILATLLAVLTLASFAWAECARVLWGEQNAGPGTPSNWRFIRADKTATDCEQDLESKLKQALQSTNREEVEKGGRKLQVTGSTMVVMGPDGLVKYYLRLMCVPDTVDPRGPKEVGR